VLGKFYVVIVDEVYELYLLDWLEDGVELEEAVDFDDGLGGELEEDCKFTSVNPEITEVGTLAAVLTVLALVMNLVVVIFTRTTLACK